MHVFRRRLFAFIAISASVSGVGRCAAGSLPHFERVAPGIVISFEGGDVDKNITSALEDVSEIPEGGILTTPYVVQPGDDICAILLAPKPCFGLAKLVDLLNPGGQVLANNLKPGMTLRLPRLNIETYQAVDALSSKKSLEEEKLLSELTQYERTREAAIIERSLGRRAVAYDAFSIYIPTKDDATAQKIVEALTPKFSKNMFVDVLRKARSPTKLYGLSALGIEEIKSRCSTSGFGGDFYDYNTLVEPDTDARGIVGRPTAPVKVVLIDTPINAAPNLYPSYAKSAQPISASWDCKWTDFKIGLHHATHLAGIVASQQQALGFMGLAPNSQIDSFEWVLPVGSDGKIDRSSDDREVRLNRKFSDCDDCAGNPLRVFLAAVSFDPFELERNPDALLSNYERLKGSGVGNAIQKRRPLLIVAAGQDDYLIARESNMPPQSFGDYGNVIVVTACEDCRRDSARIMPRANRPQNGSFTVHVAAPGGIALPGWVSETELSASKGTSQASAYVAGVVAAMIGAFPNIYTHPELVKTRLQATARPFAPQDRDVSRESAKLTTGVVDPVLALLDPTKHWFKGATGWQEASGWSGGKLQLTSLNGQKEILLKGSALLRVYRMRDIGDGAQRWTIYDDMSKTGEAEAGTVRRNELVTIDSGATLTRCDGSTIKLIDVDDFIPALSRPGQMRGACSTSH